MKVNEVMSDQPEAVEPYVMLDEAAEIMRSADVGALPVVENDRLLGVITDRDIVVRAIALGDDPARTTVGETMSSDPIVVFEDQSVEHAALLMSSHQIRRLIVIDRDNRLSGVLSLSDLSTHAGEPVLASEVLQAISE